MTRKGDAAMRVLFIANKHNAKTVDALFQIAAYCDMQGIEHIELDVSQLPDSSFVYGPAQLADIDEALAEHIDLVVTIGGDGTLLHATRLSVVLGAPIAGINFGHLGFLTNTVDEGVIALFATILSGEVIREERINLRVRVTCADDEEGQPPREYYAMNEVAAARGAKGNIVDFDFSIAGDHIAHMRGDGLIVATATGSTAYALSAGGPLVGPTFTGMIVAPLAPHTLNARPIVAERNDIIEIDMPDDMQVGDVGLFIDGDTIELDSPIKNVTIMVGPDPTVILSCRKDSFYKQISRTFFDKK